MSEPIQRGPTIERLPQLLCRIGLGRSTLYALVAGGAFPAPVKLSIRAVGWRSEEIDAWLNARAYSR